MPNSYSTIDILVVKHDDGDIEVFAPGQLPAGAMIKNSRQMQISGPKLIATPSGRMPAADFDRWVVDLKKNGLSVVYK